MERASAWLVALHKVGSTRRPGEGSLAPRRPTVETDRASSGGCSPLCFLAGRRRSKGSAETEVCAAHVASSDSDEATRLHLGPMGPALWACREPGLLEGCPEQSHNRPLGGCA